MSGHFLLPRDLPEPGIEPVSHVSLALAGRFFTTEPPASPKPPIFITNKYRMLEISDDPAV